MASNVVIFWNILSRNHLVYFFDSSLHFMPATDVVAMLIMMKTVYTYVHYLLTECWEQF